MEDSSVRYGLNPGFEIVNSNQISLMSSSHYFCLFKHTYKYRKSEKTHGQRQKGWELRVGGGGAESSGRKIETTVPEQ